MLSNFRFHHIGIVTDSISSTSKYYIEAGFKSSDKIYDPVQNVNIVFLEKTDNPKIELIEPASENSPAANIFKKTGVAPYHICYEVDCIDDVILDLRKKKFIPLLKPVKAVALDNRLICFLYNKEIGLIEILQNN